MAHILVGYELGGGHGHLYRLLPLVRALEAEGHRVTFFLRNMRENAALLAGEQRAILPAPDLVANIPGTPGRQAAGRPDRKMAERAVAVSHEIKARGRQGPVEKVLDTCRAVLEGRPVTAARVGVAQ